MKNKWYIALINSFIARAATIFLFFLAILTALKDFIFEDTSFLGEKPGICFVIFILISLVLSLVITFLLKDVKKSENITVDCSTCDTEEIKKRLINRIGSSRSLDIYYEDDIDNWHKYSTVKRYDILDYNCSNYKSIRELHGINASKKTTLYIPYCESTEYKISFNEIKVMAYDISTGKKLKVECCYANPDEKLNTHSFKIYFDKPLKPNQIFHIAYYIEFPHELDCLSSIKEIMSLSLVRIKKRIGNIEFCVMLSFEPASVCYYSYDKNNKNIEILSNQNCMVRETRFCSQEVDIRDDILSKFPIDRTETFYKIGVDVPNPKESMYIIEYSC